ncbi:MAG: acetylglutamate kinase [Sulfurovum sp.]|nr:acetylglutamate kinase [Sulfurovum sp.]
MKDKTDVIQTLLEALPYIKKFRNEIVVIKYGGSAQTSDKLKEKFAQDIVLLHTVGIKPVIVHGGGASITRLLEELDIKSRFVDGQRVTSKEAMRIVEMVLSGEINSEIVALLNSQGAKAVGVSGKDANFMEAVARDSGELGYTGDITSIDITLIDNIIKDNFVPVIAPIASGGTVGHPGYNINADLAASKIAAAIHARKIIFLTDTVGVLDKDDKLLRTLDLQEVEALKADDTIHGGMVPKVDACLEAVRGGVKKSHIIDGRLEHSLLLEILTNRGVGTCIEL